MMKLSNEYFPDPQLDSAIDLFDEGRYEEALARIQGLDPQRLDSEAQGTRLGLELACLRALHREDEARSLFWRSFDRHVEQPELLLCAGIECSECGDFNMPEQILRRLSDLQSDDHLPAYNLGVVLERDGRAEEALAWFNRSIALNDRYAPSYAGRAATLRELDRLEEAEADYRRYLELEPQDAHEWVSYGTLLSDLGRYDEAFAAYDQARALEPDSVSAWYNAAVTAARAEDPARLREAVETLHRIEPGGWRALVAGAFLAETERDLPKAWDLLQDAIDAILYSNEEDDVGENLPYVMEVALRFAESYGLEEEKTTLVERALDLGLFYPPVLDAVRAARGRRLPQARLFYVLIDGIIEDPNMLEELREADDDPEGEYGYTCPYRVWAHDAEEAEAEVLRFENEHGPGTELGIAEIEEIGGPAEEYRGVCFRGDMHTYVLDEDEDDE